MGSRGVRCFVGETYVSRTNAPDLPAIDERIRDAAAALAGTEACVRLDASIFVPADETCFHVFTAASAEAVRAAGASAAFPFDRVSEGLVTRGARA